MKTDSNLIKRDRMRYTKNSLSSSLALLALVFNVFYFVSLYRINLSYYYTWKTGLSILFNLVFMLIVFLSSEGVKNYKLSYSVILVVVGAVQLLRITYIPQAAHSTIISDGVTAMTDAQFVRSAVFLCVSAALLVISGVIGAIRSRMLHDYKKTLTEHSA